MCWAAFEAPVEMNGISLTGYTFQVLNCLAFYANPEGRNAFPSRKKIAEKCWGRGFSTETDGHDKYEEACETRVKRAIRDLRRGGWIVEDPLCANPTYLSIPSGARPTAWRLRLDLKQEGGDIADPWVKSDPGTTTSRRGDTGDPSGGTLATEGGDTGDPQEVIRGLGRGEGAESPSPEQSSTSGADEADASGSASGSSSTDWPTPPSTGAQWVDGKPRCDRHRHLSKKEFVPCGDCLNAKEYLLARDERERAADADARAARRAAIDACDLCDENGKASKRGPEGQVIVFSCDHNPPSEENSSELSTDAPPWEQELVAVSERGPMVDAPF